MGGGEFGPIDNNIMSQQSVPETFSQTKALMEKSIATISDPDTSLEDAVQCAKIGKQSYEHCKHILKTTRTELEVLFGTDK